MILFNPHSLCSISLQNRVVMAPMTRSRATGNIPNSLMAEYYGQRSSAGLIITEGTSPSPNGLGYARIPGIFSPEQREGWRLVTDAVHAGGGRIFIQLMHAGRVGSRLNLPPGAELLAPSAVAMSGQIWTDSQGEQSYDLPRAMNAADITAAIDEYAAAAAIAARACCPRSPRPPRRPARPRRKCTWPCRRGTRRPPAARCSCAAPATRSSR